MKPSTVRHRHQASAARMFMLFFGGLVLAGILLIAMTAVLKQKGALGSAPARTNDAQAK